VTHAVVVLQRPSVVHEREGTLDFHESPGVARHHGVGRPSDARGDAVRWHECRRPTQTAHLMAGTRHLIDACSGHLELGLVLPLKAITTADGYTQIAHLAILVWIHAF
jgi:hypothetical protein